VLSRSLRALMTIPFTPTFGQRFFRRHIITSFKCLTLKLQQLSLLSRIIFLHYKAAALHPVLAEMHAAYLMACACKGAPLTHWGIGLTVLLEKVVRNNFVHKLWVICLLEADFNWINKVIFAKRMIGLALENNLISGKCFFLMVAISSMQ
jgi:hypothetical protein